MHPQICSSSSENNDDHEWLCTAEPLFLEVLAVLLCTQNSVVCMCDFCLLLFIICFLLFGLFGFAYICLLVFAA